jgi:hypothetical protein
MIRKQLIDERICSECPTIVPLDRLKTCSPECARVRDNRIKGDNYRIEQELTVLANIGKPAYEPSNMDSMDRSKKAGFFKYWPFRKEHFKELWDMECTIENMQFVWNIYVTQLYGGHS